jgi:PIN domain nuclease of toxin-antitoxin system
LVGLSLSATQPTIFRRFRSFVRQSAINLGHIWALENLPYHHRDPFDRLLIAQAQTEELTLVSADGIFDLYDVDLLW